MICFFKCNNDTRDLPYYIGKTMSLLFRTVRVRCHFVGVYSTLETDPISIKFVIPSWLRTYTLVVKHVIFSTSTSVVCGVLNGKIENFDPPFVRLFFICREKRLLTLLSSHYSNLLSTPVLRCHTGCVRPFLTIFFEMFDKTRNLIFLISSFRLNISQSPIVGRRLLFVLRKMN